MGALDESESGNDGQLTGVDDTMEYSTDGGKTWTAVPSGASVVKNLKAGTYLVRYAATATSFHSDAVTVKIESHVMYLIGNMWINGQVPPVPGTGFPAGKFTPLASMPAGLKYADLGYEIEIPVLDVATRIVNIPLSENNWNVEWLGNNAGLLEGSAMPGSGISLLTGHNHLNTNAAGPFLFIKDLQANDRIFVHKSDGSLIPFKVVSNELYTPNDLKEIAEKASENSDTMVLITCEDEMVSGGYEHRRAVFAVPVSE